MPMRCSCDCRQGRGFVQGCGPVTEYPGHKRVVQTPRRGWRAGTGPANRVYHMSIELDQLKTNERPKSWSRRELRRRKVTNAGRLQFGAATTTNCSESTLREALG